MPAPAPRPTPWAPKEVHPDPSTLTHSLSLSLFLSLSLARSLSLTHTHTHPRTQGIQGLLGWDEMVMLPPGQGASEARAAQKSALAGVVHEVATSEGLGALLSRLRAAPAALDEWALANVREASRDFARASAVPKELAQRKAALESSAYASWLDARSKSDFSIFAPALKEWIEICREVASAIDPEAHVYDVLLGEFEGEERETFKGVFFFLYKTALKTHSLFLFLFPPPKKKTNPSQSVPPKSASSRSSTASRPASSLCARRSSRRERKSPPPPFALGGSPISTRRSRRSSARRSRSTWGLTSRRGGSTCVPCWGSAFSRGGGRGGKRGKKQSALFSNPLPITNKKKRGGKTNTRFPSIPSRVEPAPRTCA